MKILILKIDKILIRFFVSFFMFLVFAEETKKNNSLNMRAENLLSRFSLRNCSSICDVIFTIYFRIKK